MVDSEATPSKPNTTGENVGHCAVGKQLTKVGIHGVKVRKRSILTAEHIGSRSEDGLAKVERLSVADVRSEGHRGGHRASRVQVDVEPRLLSLNMD